MAILTDTGFPPTFINRYILSELEHYELISEADLINPNQMPTCIAIEVRRFVRMRFVEKVRRVEELTVAHISSNIWRTNPTCCSTASRHCH